MKKIILLIAFILLTMSCVPFLTPGEIILVNTLLEDQFVVSLAFESDGTAWAGIIRDQYGLVKINPDGSTEIFDHTNSCLVDSANIWDMDVDSEGNLWLLNEGLVRYDGSTFTKWDTINDGQLTIVAYNQSLAIDGNDNIWVVATNPYINCPNVKLVCFDGVDFTVHEPSPLGCGSIYSVADIAIDKMDNPWFSFHSYNQGLVFMRYAEGEWTTFDTSDVGFSPYQVNDIEFDSDNNLWFNDDYLISSMYIPNRPTLCVFNGETQATPVIRNAYISEIAIDDDDNVWVSGASPNLGLYDGRNWVYCNDDDAVFSREMKFSPDGDMWLAISTGIRVYRYSQTN